MDIELVISQLRAEQRRLDEIITTLQSLGGEGVQRTPLKRGRKFMDTKARAVMSERMKRYWQEKQKREQSAARAAARAGRVESVDGSETAVA